MSLGESKRRAAMLYAQKNYPNATPTAENATDYDQHRDKCCINIDHWKGLVRGNQRLKLEKYVEDLRE
jgi:hypothetical protein